MHTLSDFGRRAVACVLAATMTFSTVPAVAAGDTILGTITVTGTAFAATSTTDWVKFTATRPLISGDRIKTAHGASLVADFQELGIIGLYPDGEISVNEKGTDVAVEAQRGRVAFHLAPNSRLKLTAGSATVAAGERKAEGYVEFNEQGVPELVVESDDLTVVPAGGTAKVLVRGDRIVLTGAGVPARVATLEEEKAAVAAPQKQSKKAGGLSPLQWTAIGAAVAAVGIGVGVGVAAGGGGGGDSNGSE